jgi:ABC-type multidrug transport system fused ATPase/permease subunit
MSFSQTTPGAVLRDGFKLIWRFIKAHPFSFFLALIGSLLFAVAIIASAQIIGWVTDNVIIPILDEGADQDGLLTTSAVLILGVAFAKAIGVIFRRASAGWLTFKTRQDTRNDLVDHQLSLRMSWFDKQAIGNLLAVADADVDQGTGVLHPLPYATGVSFLLVGSLILIGASDPWLGLFALVGLTIIVLVNLWGSWTTYWLWEDVQKNRGRVSALAHESFDGALTIKSLGREDYVGDRFQDSSETLRDGLIEVYSKWRGFQTVAQALPQVLTLVLLVIGVVRIEAGFITTGEMVTIAYLLTLLAFPTRFLGFILWEMAASLASWQRVQEVMTADDFIQYGLNQAAVGSGPAPVLGSEVSFAYEASSPVLQDLHLDLRAGTTLAVVGATGSGKSTLGLLMSRLWDPDTGDIRIDGRDLRDFAVSELSREVGYVSQTAFLFDDTVAGNITLGMPFSREDVESAARLAGAAEFISHLPEGYDTSLGERGTTLSGGQRQRVALARALIRKPRLLLLDDATSAVDPSVEAEILRSLKSADLPSTIVVVAYRPASIRLADEVVFIDDRRIVAHGTHEELLASTPAYADLVQAYERDAERMAGES